MKSTRKLTALMMAGAMVFALLGSRPAQGLETVMYTVRPR